MKREDIIRDIHALDAELAALEAQYRLPSADFYHFYRTGELEQSRDFIRWAAFYEATQKREISYRQLVYAYFRELRQRSGLGSLALDPTGTGVRRWMTLPAMALLFIRWRRDLSL